MRNIFINELTNLAEKDPNIFLIVGDLGYGVIDEFQNKFPERFLNVGVAEQNMIGVAAGLAKSGYKVFVYSIANFPTFRCLEQIRNDVLYHSLDVTVVAVGAGFTYGTAGYSHHAVEDLTIMRSLRKIKIFSPANSAEVKGSLKVIMNASGPNYIRLGKLLDFSHDLSMLNGEPIQIKLGLNEAVFACGSILHDAILAVKKVEDLSDRTIAIFSNPIVNPLSIPTKIIKDFKRIFVVEEHIQNGGLGTALMEYVSDKKIECEIIRLGIENLKPEVIGSQDYLKNIHEIDSDGIAKRIMEFN
jgi:transketolase